MDFTLELTNIIPADLNLMKTLMFSGLLCLAVMILSFLVRLMFGRNSKVNQAVSAALGILLIYAVTVVIYTFNPRGLARFLSPLPYVSLTEDKLILFSFSGASVPVLCHQILSMILLAFLVNLIAGFIPEKSGALGWLFSRTLSVLAAMGGHYLIHLAIVRFIPGFLEGYAPMILLCILLFMLLLGILKVVLGIVLAVVNPIFGALYTFFFSHRVGRQLSKAVLTTFLITALFLLLNHLGYSVIPISIAALTSYVPFAGMLLLAWYLLSLIL